LEDSLPILADHRRFEEGVPLEPAETLVTFSEALWKKAADRLIPAMGRGFPKIRRELDAIRPALVDGRLDPESLVQAMLKGRDEETARVASDLEIRPETLRFTLGQVLRPLAEKRSESLEPLVSNLRWHKGYCPICGSMPDLGFLKGDGGQKWLKCSLCAHEWRFMRTMCPFCESNDHEKMEFYFVTDREHERVELCHGCNRYLLNIDLRPQAEEAVLEVAAIGLIHLDVLAQEKGFVPMAVCGWDLVVRGDISSSTVPLDSGRWPM
jgi:FdhE protein